MSLVPNTAVGLGPRPSSSPAAAAPARAFMAGKLGSFTFGADKTVLLGPPFVFTSDNINQFDF
jgi:hypothetical protein